MQKVLVAKASKQYFSPQFQTHIHCSNPARITGFNIRTLTDPEKKDHDLFCKLFKNVVKSAYEQTTFWYPQLAEDLLELFKNSPIFKKEENSESHSIHEALNLLHSDNKDLTEALYHIRQPSKLSEGDPSGFCELKDLIHPNDVTNDAVAFNLLNCPLDIIRVMFDDAIAESLKEQRLQWRQEGRLRKENRETLTNEFIKKYGLSQHPYKDLITVTFD